MALPGRRERILTPEKAILAEVNTDVADRALRYLLRTKSIPLGRWPGLEFDDMQGQAYEELCHAAYIWAPNVGEFPNFAFRTIYFRLIDWLRQNGPRYRSTTSDELKKRPRTVSWVYDGEYEDRGLPTDQLISDRELERDFADTLVGRRYVIETFRTLPERERFVMTHLFIGRHTEKNIGEMLGLSEGRISQIKTKALQRLRAELAPEETSFQEKRPRSRSSLEKAARW